MTRLIDLIAAMKSEEALMLIPTLPVDELQKQFSSQGYESYTALHIAALLGLDQVVKSLIDHGANVRARDKMGSLPMHYAAEASQFADIQSKIQIIRHLHQAESFLIFDIDEDFNTPLHIAAMYGETDLVKELLRLGSGAYIKNKEGLVPRELVPTENVELANLLRTSEISLTHIAIRACKKLPFAEQRPFYDKLPDHLLTQYVILDEPAPRLAVWCFNQAREQEALKRQQANESTADELAEKLSKLTMAPF